MGGMGGFCLDGWVGLFRWSVGWLDCLDGWVGWMGG